MLLIFMFSAQDATESTEVSNSVLVWIMDHMRMIMPGAILDFLMGYIRKVAHFTIYMMLGIWAVLAWSEYRQETHVMKRILPPWIVAMIYALSDEFHQRFVPGRAGQFRDVCIDSYGAIVGILLVQLGVYLIHRRHDKRQELKYQIRR